jgi:hypothetical protein
MRRTGHVARLGEQECMQGFVVKPEGNRLLGRCGRRLEDLREIGWSAMDWSSAVQRFYILGRI